jgi:hypothetical protein
MKPLRPGLCAFGLLVTGCSRSNNLLLGRVETTVADHQVVVTDCYRTQVPPPKLLEGTAYFQPCRDADVQIRDEELFVNGRSYGRLNPRDRVLVDHGAVSIRHAAADLETARH